MAGSSQRVAQAFAFAAPDRTPLFEIFQPYHPIHWRICGRNVATDMALAWDAMADGITWEELVQAQVKAEFEIRKFFGLDMVLTNPPPARDAARPVRVGRRRWTLAGVPYCLNQRTGLVVLEDPSQQMSDSHKASEADVRKQLDSWDGTIPPAPAEDDPVLSGVRALAERDGLDWAYMGEVGAGTAVAFYPPFVLMWMAEAPDRVRRWIERQKLPAFARTRRLVRSGCSVIAMGGDVSCDKGPFVSPASYRELILPVIQEHVDLIHELGAKAVYTSDGNHWPIKDDFFFRSRIDGYKEVDRAAGMTWPRLIEEGVAGRVCIVGNIDARHTLCRGTPEAVRAEVHECLRHGRQIAGGHILHASHSVHEDVKSDNYFAMVNAYREFFGLERLP